MAKPHLRDLQRERLWRKTFLAWQFSGQSIRAFCEDHELNESAFYFWRKELRKRDSESQPAFIPVTVVSTPTATIEVRCPSGHVVVVTGSDESMLRSIFAALEPEAAC